MAAVAFFVVEHWTSDERAHDGYSRVAQDDSDDEPKAKIASQSGAGYQSLVGQGQADDRVLSSDTDGNVTNDEG